MLIKLRKRMAREESGFTLIELLVVMLILGILAAIAIPAFLSQRQKGQDSDAKAGVRTLETAAETYAVENDGDYGAGMTEAALTTIEPAVADVDTITTLDGTTPAGGYTLTVTSDSDNTFTLTRAGNGAKTRSCDVPGDGNDGGGCDSGSW